MATERTTLDQHQLGDMMKSYSGGYVDSTDLIRECKHSEIFRREINTLQTLMEKYPDEPDNVAIEAITECSFLCTYYTDLYNKIRKKQISMDILFTMIDKLEEIEKGDIDQHNCAVQIGKLLKQIYFDQAVEKNEKSNTDDNNAKQSASATASESVKKISYAEYKLKRTQIESALSK